MQEHQLREQLCELGKSIFDRGLTHGSTGNISVRCADGWLLTPTGSNLGQLDPARLSKLDWNGKLISGNPPSKEAFLHLAMYQERASESGPSCTCMRRIRSRSRCWRISTPRICCRR